MGGGSCCLLWLAVALGCWGGKGSGRLEALEEGAAGPESLRAAFFLFSLDLERCLFLPLLLSREVVGMGVRVSGWQTMLVHSSSSAGCLANSLAARVSSLSFSDFS